MEAIGVIPARYGATRFEGKLLKDLCGKPVIQHVYERAKKAKLLDDLIIAADDDRIVKAVEAFGGKVVFTSKTHTTGTDRLTEVVNDIDVKLIVNIQGDEPLIQPLLIDDLVRTMQDPDEAGTVMATVVKKSHSEEEFRSPDVVKAIVNQKGYAMYFSRSPIPTLLKFDEKSFFYKHIGIYAYRKDFLFTFKKLAKSALEKNEKLEQLRALEAGYRIKAIETNFETVGVDTPDDLELAKRMIQKEMAHA